MNSREKILGFTCVLLIVALYFVVMLQKWGLTLWGDEIDFERWGNWSSAIAGIATTVAVVVAAIGIWVQYAAFVDEKRRRQEDELANRTAEETQVVFWFQVAEVVNDRDEVETYTWDLCVQNTTNSPIYRWQLEFDKYPQHVCNFVGHPLLPHTEIDLFNLPFLDGVEPKDSPTAVLYFEGRSGQIWKKTVLGQITAVEGHSLDCEHSTTD